ncbi:hypothetical protein ABS71_21500 [bacterium SCN 62-11]|nr:hypothetical protein [Candidatus Eremiobacteraeota bacterium]ODT56759.1 MAG: hypothetical protein ABS71_21500 [bacterium SCN 62-11]
MPDVLDQVLQFLREGAYSSLPSLFPALVAYHQELSQELERFALLYPGENGLIAAWQADLGDYQNAVGALVEQAWGEAMSLWEEVSGHLLRRRAATAQVRRQQGFSVVPALDEFAWSLHRGRPDAVEALKLLREAEREVSYVPFPDPRLTQEWQELWGPLCQELTRQLQTSPHLSQLPRLEEFWQRHRHWLRRAEQRRDFGGVPWWQALREQLTGSRPISLDSAYEWLNRDFAEWPEADRQLRLHYIQEARDWLKEIGERPASDSVAFGDLRYDRWLWLSQPKV